MNALDNVRVVNCFKDFCLLRIQLLFNFQHLAVTLLKRLHCKKISIVLYFEDCGKGSLTNRSANNFKRFASINENWLDNDPHATLACWNYLFFFFNLLNERFLMRLYGRNIFRFERFENFNIIITIWRKATNFVNIWEIFENIP